MVSSTAIISSTILFILIFGMSATVQFEKFQTQTKNKGAICTGVFLQFIVLPLLGFLVVKALDMNDTMGITLLIVTSSPGGSYSNWWCSLFNADLALSVTMTAISTLLAIAMLPLNVFLYANAAYGSSVVSSFDWVGLGVSLAVVIGAITTGLFCSWKIKSGRFRRWANRIGNVAGIALIVFSVVAPEGGTTDLTGRGWEFYIGVALPIVLGLIFSNVISSFVRLKKPERVTVSVECCYQNTAIAISTVLTVYEGNEQRDALGVPFYYTGMQALLLGIYCLGAWKAGWTKAPYNENFCTVILKSYEVPETDEEEDDGLEGGGENEDGRRRSGEGENKDEMANNEFDDENLEDEVEMVTASLKASSDNNNNDTSNESELESNPEEDQTDVVVAMVQPSTSSGSSSQQQRRRDLEFHEKEGMTPPAAAVPQQHRQQPAEQKQQTLQHDAAAPPPPLASSLPPSWEEAMTAAASRENNNNGEQQQPPSKKEQPTRQGKWHDVQNAHNGFCDDIC